MNGDEIRRWRPQRFADLVGAQNQQRIQHIRQQILRKGRIADPLLIVGIYGYAKTSLARLILLSMDCRQRDLETADPCGQCADCRCSGKFYHGYGWPYRRFEYDCTRLGRPDILALIDDHVFETKEAIFFDELHHLHDRHSQEPLLKFIEDFDGVVIGAIMEDRLPELIPPLQERFQVLQLTPPTEGEMVDFFWGKLSEWQLTARKDDLKDLVIRSGCSFRVCLKVLGAAADRDDRTLDRRLIDEMLNSGSGDKDGDDSTTNAA